MQRFRWILWALLLFNVSCNVRFVGPDDLRPIAGPPTNADASIIAADASISHDTRIPEDVSVDAAEGPVLDQPTINDSGASDAGTTDAGSTPVFVIATHRSGTHITFREIHPFSTMYDSVMDGVVTYGHGPRRFDASDRFRFQVYSDGAPVVAYHFGGSSACIYPPVDYPGPEIRVFTAEQQPDGSLSPQTSWTEIIAHPESLDGICALTVNRGAMMTGLAYPAFHTMAEEEDSARYFFSWRVEPAEYAAAHPGAMIGEPFHLRGENWGDILHCLDTASGAPAIVHDPSGTEWHECTLLGEPVAAPPVHFIGTFQDLAHPEMGDHGQIGTISNMPASCTPTPGTYWRISRVTWDGLSMTPLYDPGPSSGLGCIPNAGTTHEQPRHVLPGIP